MLCNLCCNHFALHGEQTCIHCLINPMKTILEKDNLVRLFNFNVNHLVGGQSSTIISNKHEHDYKPYSYSDYSKKYMCNCGNVRLNESKSIHIITGYPLSRFHISRSSLCFFGKEILIYKTKLHDYSI